MCARIRVYTGECTPSMWRREALAIRVDAVVAVHHFLTAINILNLYRCRYRFGSNGFYEGGNKNRVAGKGLDDFQLFLTRLGPLRMIYVCVL